MSATFTSLDVTGIVVTGAGFAYKLGHLLVQDTTNPSREEDSGRPALRAMVLILGLLFGTFVLTPAAVGAAVDALVGISGTTRLAANLLSISTVWAQLALVLYLSQPAEIARRRLKHYTRVYQATMITAVVLFVINHPPVTPQQQFAGVYMFVWAAWTATGCAITSRMAWQYARQVSPVLFRLGLRLLATSFAMGVVFILLVTATTIQELVGAAVIPGNLGALLYGPGTILLLVGLVLPSLGPRIGLESLWWQISRRRAIRRITPLWTQITSACPEVVLDRTLLALAPHPRRLLAQRLVVETTDGWMQLREYLTDSDIAVIDEVVASSPIRASRRAAARSAAQFVCAVHRRTVDTAPSGDWSRGGRLCPDQTRTFADTARFLGQVARAAHRSPVVDKVLSRVGTAAGANLQPG